MADFPPIVKALAIVPKIFAVPSILGSAYIFREVTRSKKKRGDTYQRLMAAMSFCDIIGSIGAFLGTWPIPRGTPGVYMASGTTQTCIAAGFFNQLVGPCTPMYNGALGIYYVCRIRYNWPEKRIKRVEMICHAVIISIGVLTSIAAIPLNLYNNADNWVCWMAEQPLGCLDSYRYGEEANCERGDNAWIYQWAWFYSLGWASFIVMTVSLFIVYQRVRRVERSIDSYDVTGGRRRDNSNAVFWQGVLYCLAFMLTWFFTTLTRILFLILHRVYMPILFLLATFWPLQGFWNCLIYLRPRYVKYRKTYPEGSFCQMVHVVLYPDAAARYASSQNSTRYSNSNLFRKSGNTAPSKNSRSETQKSTLLRFFRSSVTHNTASAPPNDSLDPYLSDDDKNAISSDDGKDAFNSEDGRDRDNFADEFNGDGDANVEDSQNPRRLASPGGGGRDNELSEVSNPVENEAGVSMSGEEEKEDIHEESKQEESPKYGGDADPQGWLLAEIPGDDAPDVSVAFGEPSNQTHCGHHTGKEEGIEEAGEEEKEKEKGENGNEEKEAEEEAEEIEVEGKEAEGEQAKEAVAEEMDVQGKEEKKKEEVEEKKSEKEEQKEEEIKAEEVPEEVSELESKVSEEELKVEEVSEEEAEVNEVSEEEAKVNEVSEDEVEEEMQEEENEVEKEKEKEEEEMTHEQWKQEDSLQVNGDDVTQGLQDAEIPEDAPAVGAGIYGCDGEQPTLPNWSDHGNEVGAEAKDDSDDEEIIREEWKQEESVEILYDGDPHAWHVAEIPED